MTIAGMVKSSLVDFPGLISCVLFVPGCNLDCFYCHNRSLLDGTATLIPTQEVESFLHKRVGQLDGVVITGGEPTLQPGLLPFLRAVRALGYKTKLDTNGTLPAVVRAILQEGLCDYCAVDYKAPARRQAEICGIGADPEKTIETIDALIGARIPFEVRTTVIPQLSKEDLVQMAKELSEVPRYTLNPYRKPDRFRPAEQERIDQRPYTREEILGFADAMRPYQPFMLV